MTNVLIQNPNGKGSFDEIGRLPNKTGQAIDWNPTAVPTAISTNGSGGGLSTGAKAGVGVGVAIAGLLLIAGAVILYLRRRRNQRQTKASELDAPPKYGSTQYDGTEKSELASDLYQRPSTGTAGDRSELSPERAIWEMESPGQVPELENTNMDNVQHDASVKRTSV